MENDNNLAKGLYFYQPHERAPEFVKGNLSIDCKEFYAYMQANHKDGQIKIDLLVSKNGKGYGKLNTYVKEEQPQNFQQPPQQPAFSSPAPTDTCQQPSNEPF